MARAARAAHVEQFGEVVDPATVVADGHTTVDYPGAPPAPERIAYHNLLFSYIENPEHKITVTPAAELRSGGGHTLLADQCQDLAGSQRNVGARPINGAHARLLQGREEAVVVPAAAHGTCPGLSPFTCATVSARLRR